ncbi:uncharacterized protein [Palaemon carinicauda]|uniref:uncharacterized protein n=1 Tax=Palaemon carinicauda TaxID=392227 RepID=UPI0035B57DD5
MLMPSQPFCAATLQQDNVVTTQVVTFPSQQRDYSRLDNVVDSHTRSPLVSTAFVFEDGWITRFGIPDHISSDGGTSFTSQLWSSLANLLGIILHQTTSYNPTANGMVERFHRTLKAALKSLFKDSNWFTKFPWVFPGLRTTRKDALNVLAAEVVYGDPLVIPA